MDPSRHCVFSSFFAVPQSASLLRYSHQAPSLMRPSKLLRSRYVGPVNPEHSPFALTLSKELRLFLQLDFLTGQNTAPFLPRYAPFSHTPQTVPHVFYAMTVFLFKVFSRQVSPLLFFSSVDFPSCCRYSEFRR